MIGLLQLLVDRLTKLSLSYKKSKDQEILEYICSNLSVVYNEDTKMNPNLNLHKQEEVFQKQTAMGL